MKKRIGKFGALVVMGMFVSLFFLPRAIADAPTENDVPGSYIFDIDYNTDDTAYFAVKHEDSAELFRIQEDGKVGIGDDDPDFKLEVAATSGDGYFGVSSAKDNDGDIFIIDSSGNVGVGLVGPASKLSVLGEVTVGTTWASSSRAPSGGMLIEGDVGIGTTSPTHKLTIQSTDDDTLRLIGPNGIPGYGAKLNFGDYDCVFITEDTDDAMYIYGYERTAIMGGNVGIGTTTPGARLHVVPVAGGAASIGVSCSATGLAAVATGYYTVASAYYSTAMGYDTTASGVAAITMGYSTEANAYYSTAMGYETIASGAKSTAMGFGTIASNHGSTAMGASTTASGEFSTAMGASTTASGMESTAMGYGTTASGTVSLATGDSTTASGWGSTAMGSKITVSGVQSFGIGLDTTSRTITQDHTMAIVGGNVGIGTVSPNNRLTVNGDADFLGKISIGGITSPSTTLHVDGDVAFGKGSTLTVTDYEVTVTHSYHLIDASSGTADLDTISGGDVAGQILIITAASGDTITVQSGEDNIILSVAELQMDDNDTLVLIYDGTTNWLELSHSDNI